MERGVTLCPVPEAPAYPSRRIAKKALAHERRQNRRGKLSKVYQCVCSAWHIGDFRFVAKLKAR